MNTTNEAFFAKEGQRGITSTEANYIAVKAKEQLKFDESAIRNISFVDKTVGIMGKPDSETVTQIGSGRQFITEAKEILERISKTHSLIAWLREAIAAKQMKELDLNYLSLSSFLKEEGISPLTIPVSKSSVTFENVLQELSVKERHDYYAYEAIASTIGTFIHKNSPLDVARKEMAEALVKPTRVVEGVNVMVHKSKLSIDTESVENFNNELLTMNREANAALNSIKFKLEKRMQELNLQNANEYQAAMQEYSNEEKMLTSKFNSWKEEKLKKIQSLKIVIPNELQGLFDELNQRSE